MAELEEQIAGQKNEQDSWLNKCESFFKRLRSLKSEYQQSDYIGKRVVLESLGAKFVRTGEKMTVELAHPYSVVLSKKPRKISSERQKNRIEKPNSGVLGPKMSEWLRESDSNRRPIG